MRKHIKGVTFLLGILLTGASFAQENSSMNTYTPYSMYGLGDLAQPGLISAKSMAGITSAVRDKNQIDYQNPAGATARDSIFNFVLDFGGEMRNFYSKSGSSQTSYNTANFHHLAVAFPIGRRFGVNLGITPFSSVGYDVELRDRNDTTLANIGDVRYQYRGEDGLNQMFLNLGFNVTPNISVGVGGRYYFGSINRYYNEVYNDNSYYYSIYSSKSLRVSDFSPVLGVQYTQPLSNHRSLVFGASWESQTKLSSTESKQSEVVSSMFLDTILNTSQSVKVVLPMRLDIGVSYTNPDKWMLGAEFNYRDWSKTEITGEDAMSAAYDLRLGGYYIPNRYDVRYFWKRVTYRGGLRYSQTPFKHNGNNVNDMAVTVGLGIPMRGAGFLNVGAEVGRRGTTSKGMIEETYVNFTLGLTLFESWFRRYRYE